MPLHQRKISLYFIFDFVLHSNKTGDERISYFLHFEGTLSSLGQFLATEYP